MEGALRAALEQKNCGDRRHHSVHSAASGKTIARYPANPGEVQRATMQMKNHNAWGPDGIPAEIFKFGVENLASKVCERICKIRQDKQIPSDLRNANIITIYKKGTKLDCGSYRGIAFLSIPRKILARVLLNRVWFPLAEDILPESQCGFRISRGTMDMIFVARQIPTTRWQQLPSSTGLEQSFHHPYRGEAGMRYCTVSLHYLLMCHNFIMSCSWPSSVWSLNWLPTRWATFQPESSQEGQNKSDKDCRYRPPVCDDCYSCTHARTHSHSKASHYLLTEAYQSLGLSNNIRKTKIIYQSAPGNWMTSWY